MTSEEGEVHLQEASKSGSYKVQEDEKKKVQPHCTALHAVEGSMEKKAYECPPYFNA